MIASVRDSRGKLVTEEFLRRCRLISREGEGGRLKAGCTLLGLGRDGGEGRSGD